MKTELSFSLIAASLFVLALLGCSESGGTADSGSNGAAATHERSHDGGEHGHDGHEHGREGRGEHDRDSGEYHGEESEESGIELSLDQTYDNVRNGARLVLAYDQPSNSFVGTVENATDQLLEQVRVEVHLSNGTELGPTTPADLKPGQKIDVKLEATTTDFDHWTAHPEVGRGEHGHDEGDAEHDRVGR